MLVGAVDYARVRVYIGGMSRPITLYIDADACPVKPEAYRVAERFVRHGTALKVVVVSNSPIAVPRDAFVERVVVGQEMDAADHYIAERAERGDVVITADVPLAAPCGEGRRGGDRAQRPAVLGRCDRHGARHPQSDERPAQRRCSDQRAKGVRAGRPLPVPRRARRGADAARSGGVRRRGVRLPRPTCVSTSAPCRVDIGSR